MQEQKQKYEYMLFKDFMDAKRGMEDQDIIDFPPHAEVLTVR